MLQRLRDYFDHPYRLLGWLLIATSVVAALLIIGATRAFAADVAVTWTQPTTNTDGSSIPLSGAGAIVSNRVEWGSCVGSAFGTAAGSQTIPAATSYLVTGLAPATYCFRVTALNTYGSESAVSNVAQRAVAAPIPNPPIVTQAVIAGMQQTPVYSVTASGSLSTLMGFADVGVACVGPVLATYRGAKFRQVARADVKMWGSTSLRLAAPCA